LENFTNSISSKPASFECAGLCVVDKKVPFLLLFNISSDEEVSGAGRYTSSNRGFSGLSGILG
jgi:hypothetical protein